MILDHLDNIEKYASLHPLFAQAIAYIKSTDLNNIEIGKYDIADGLKAILAIKMVLQQPKVMLNLNAIIKISTYKFVFVVKKPLVGNLVVLAFTQKENTTQKKM
jgi:hypothetical protein